MTIRSSVALVRFRKEMKIRSHRWLAAGALLLVVIVSGTALAVPLSEQARTRMRTSGDRKSVV